jgi:3-hydroxyacyl-[acyl-carrier-protein] dehydratase
MLHGDFYTASDVNVEGNGLKAILNLNVNHKIFEGHFPGHPVVPGVCMMQMVKDMLELQLLRETRLEKASTMKFLNMINPEVNNRVKIELKQSIAEDGKINVDAQLVGESLVFFKFKGVFHPLS